LVTEYLGGGHLGQFGDEWPGWTRFLDALDQVLAALAFAHARGVVHCDLKPENVLFDDDGRTAKLTDLGVAHLSAHSIGDTEHRAWRTEELTGTPTYMSPEQAEGNLGAYGP